MNKVQNIQKAKSFIEMLSRMVDPTTLEPIEESVLAKKEIQDTFIFISKLLEELIENDGEVIQVTEQARFQADAINKNLVEISNEPVSIIGFASRLNHQVNTKIMKRSGYAKIQNWLIDNGFLTTKQVKVIKHEKKLQLTNRSNQIGIISVENIDDKTGEIKQTILLTADAQNFILDNLENIFSN